MARSAILPNGSPNIQSCTALISEMDKLSNLRMLILKDHLFSDQRRTLVPMVI